jgi:hypothetical protein
MELASFVALWLTAIVLGFSRAELAKVLCRFGNDILEQFHLDATQFFTCCPS